MKNTRVLVAQLGARKHYQEPLLFHQWGILDSLYTDFYAGHSKLAQALREPNIYKHLPSFFRKGFDRYDPALEKARVIHFPWFGYRYALALRKASSQNASSIFIWAGKEFCQRIIQNGLGNANVVYGFNGASLELFEYAKARDMWCVLDQTLAERSLVHQLLLEEEQSWQGWLISPFRVNDADIELVQREQQEQDLADHIICGSNFVKDSLIARGVSENKISVVALGRRKEGQLLQRNPNCKTPQKRGDGLRILFAGAVGLRKGIPYLLEALRNLKGQIPFTCKVAGSIQIKPTYIDKYSDVCNFLGRVPRSRMTELYAWADVFVLPSICEGSAMVTYEALSWGLPIITTYNSGSIIRNRTDGFIVPIKDSKSISDMLKFSFHEYEQINKVNTCIYLDKSNRKSYSDFKNIFSQLV